MSGTAVLLDVRGMKCQRGTGASAFTLEVPRLHIRAGEVLAITGPSGCGKSTLLDLLGLVLRPAETSSFAFAGVDVAALWAQGKLDGLSRLRAASLGYVLQTGGLLPFLSVRKNLALSPKLCGRKSDPAFLAHLIETLGLGPLLDKKPRALSIGERQRSAIARALAHRPALLLADEPTASLDPLNAERVLALLLKLVRESGTALVLVSHAWDKMEALGLPRIEARVVSADGGTLTRFETKGES